MNILYVRRPLSWGVAVMALGLPSAQAAQTRDPKPVPEVRVPVIPMQMPPRDRPPEPQAGTGSISGRIIDGVTGRPLPRARVRLTGRTPKGPVLTDANGAFTFTGLPAGPHTFVIERNGYLPTSYPEQGRLIRGGSKPVTLGVGEARDDVSIAIFRGGSISGRITDAYGEPLEGASVALLNTSRQRGGVRAMTQTNDLGEFRLPRLAASRYVLMVRQAGFQNDPGERPLPQSLPTYYPGTLKRDQAQVIVVNRGEAITGVDMTMVEGVPSIVNGVVVLADGQAHSGGSVTARLVGDFGSLDGGTGVRPDGTFRFQLAPGEYNFEVRMRPGAPNQPVRPDQMRLDSELFGTARVTITGGDVEPVAILVGRGATASGRVIFQGRTPPPVPLGNVRVPIYNNEGQSCQGGQATVGPDWSFKAEGLAGTCSASLRTQFGQWMVRAVMYRGRNLIDDAFTFEPGQHYGDVQILLTDRSTEVELRVTDEAGQITREFVAIAFPADKVRWNHLPRYVKTFAPTVQVPPAAFRSNQPPPGSGSYALPPVAPSGRLVGLPPGEYHIIAVDDVQYEDTLDPAILEKLIPGATRVMVSEEAPYEITLHRQVFADLVR
jgi:hypothetical protein